MFPSLTSRSLDRLVTQAVAIEATSAQEADALAFMARFLTQATLPHSRVAGTEYQRRNGLVTLTLLAPSAVGLPYGTIPRLLLVWLATEAVRTQKRELELGDTLSAFMRELELVPTGGRWGTITRLKDQTRRLFSSAFYLHTETPTREAGLWWGIADRHEWAWDPMHPDQARLWTTTVTLSETFYNEVVRAPVPLDMRALRALRKSPLALDIYTWLTYRSSYLKQPVLIRWYDLSVQFGADYGRLRDFRVYFLEALRRVSLVYQGARFDLTDKGLVLKPGRPHVSK